MPKHLTTPNTYRTLVSKIAKELTELDTFIRRRTAEGYWKIGKYIHDHLLEHKDRAVYGASIYEKLEKEVNRDATTLTRMVQFYRAYPIHAPAHELSWGHYRSLITIKDKDQRKRLEREILRKNWDTKKVREYLSTKRELNADDEAAIPTLPFNRGRLHTYQIVKANQPLAKISPLALDLGFRLQHLVPGNAKYKEDDIVEAVRRGGNFAGVKKVEAEAKVSKDELFTYQAQVDRIIDGDTLIVSFDFNCVPTGTISASSKKKASWIDVSISQKIRLRGIDCPEMDTEEGKKAKRFVESRLKDGDGIIVKTHKDRSDKFDRYLADIFYKDGNFLNQELLDERLARVWEI